MNYTTYLLSETGLWNYHFFLDQSAKESFIQIFLLNFQLYELQTVQLQTLHYIYSHTSAKTKNKNSIKQTKQNKQKTTPHYYYIE